VRAGEPARTVNHFAATTSRADGEEARFVWIDLVTKAGVRRLPPFDGVTTAYLCQTTNSVTLPATLSGFRLDHSAGPIRHLDESLGPRGPGVDWVDTVAVIQSTSTN
jgi:hypothetical protein